MYIKFKDGKSKAFTLSYDDAVVQDIRLMEILDKNGIKCTFNINSGNFLKEDAVRDRFYGKMKLSEAKELYIPSCHEIACHGAKHKSLARVNLPEAVYEVIHDREMLEKEFGRVIRGMAYANGSFNDDVIRILKDCGIKYSRTTKVTGGFDLPENWLALQPTCHHNDPRLMELADKFLAPMTRHHEVMLFYVWGHSYEFDINDNWNVIEELASKMGGKDDVWYCTNMEICEYTEAYKRLEASVDERIIYNPSAIDVWAYTSFGIVCIKAGETLRL